ncbi:MAG TPA: hypothetical protein VG602_09195 [Actinomycetota bacterium]|nr:hypothetical protein [Actinomycetota bacterium]
MSTQPGDGEDRELRETLRLLREAHEARGRLLARQRWEFADRLRDETEERDRELARLRQEIERLAREAEGRRRELERLMSTRTFRYTAGLRNAYGWFRARLRSR